MDERSPGYYAIIPATVRYDDSIPANAKLLYGEISALLNEDGFCFAGNQYFADLYGVTIKSISRLISTLEKANYIILTIEKDKTGKICNRKISLKMSAPDEHPVDKNVYTPGQNCGGGMDKNVHHTNISIKEINKESSETSPKKKSNPPKTDFDPRPIFASWIDTVLPTIVPQGVVVPAKDKNALYVSLVNFSENRYALKNPIPSKAAVTAILNRLVKYSQNAPYMIDAMIDILETATSSNWLTVYKPKEQNTGRAQKPQGGRVYEEL